MRKTMIAAAVALGLVLSSVAAFAYRDDGPRDLRRVDGVALAPGAPAPDEPMEVVGPDGEPIRCADGAILTVTMNDAMAVPDGLDEARIDPARSGAGKTTWEVTEGIVPRCGPGGSTDPVFVPESVGRELRDAPARFVP